MTVIDRSKVNILKTTIVALSAWPKSAFLFGFRDVFIICQHVHKLELRTFIKICAARLPDK